MNRYYIRWKSKTNNKSGRGKFLFTKERAEELCRWLNFDWPDILHEPVLAESEDRNLNNYEHNTKI
jgi:hypothetical protein